MYREINIENNSQKLITMYILDHVLIFFSILAFYCFAILVLLNIVYFGILGFLFSLPYPLMKIFINMRINPLWFFLLLMLFFGSLFNLLISQHGIGGVIVIFGSLSVAIFVLEHPQRMLIHSKIILLIMLAVYSHIIFIQEIDPNMIFEERSRNIVGMHIVFFTLFHAFLLYICKRKIMMIIPIFSLVLTVAMGRSSLFAVLLLVGINLFVFMKKKKYRFFVFIPFLIVTIIYFMPIIIQYYEYTKFFEQGIESARYDIWRDFFSNVNFFTFLWGMDTISVLITREDGNLHNDFINILARTGMGFLAFFPVYLICIIKNIYFNKFYVLALLFVLSFRASFDNGAFTSGLGVISYSLLLYPLFLNKNGLQK